MKREREESGEREEREKKPPTAQHRSGQDNEENGNNQYDVESDDNHLENYGGKKIAERVLCPYLDTINREILDFDFEKQCSVTLSTLNVYACLVCGKYFAGRGKSTPAYTHALQCSHHVFINLKTTKVYCLPDNYEILDASLSDIKYALDPTYTKTQMKELDTQSGFSTTLIGERYFPGIMGLNNIKLNDGINAVIQGLSHVNDLRDFLLIKETHAHLRNPLVDALGELFRKLWNPHAFKAQVSPHELLQAISNASEGKYKVGERVEPTELMTWLLNALHLSLGGTKKKNSSIIYKCFQGEVVVTTYRKLKEKDKEEMEKRGEEIQMSEEMEGYLQPTSQNVPFLSLSLDIPPSPLFKSENEKNIIPQVPLFELLEKYNGIKIHHIARTLERKKYLINRLPNYLILYIRRFTKNYYFEEKNNTIVNFPVKLLNLRDCLTQEAAARYGNSTTYNLVANIKHEAKLEEEGKRKIAEEGSYKVDVYHKGCEKWFELQDLHVRETMPQLIAQSEAFIQIYEKADQ